MTFMFLQSFFPLFVTKSALQS
jgi:hypothetical protein